jgi:DNA-binding response OmpR family regulator
MQPRSELRPRVLIVEDEPMVLELITTRLELAGYQTFGARDGYQGLARLLECKPAAMIVDINMPNLDGFGVLRHMQISGEVRRVPTMVLTARNQTDDVKQAIALGARDFLSKPFKDEQLLARVARLVRRPKPAVAGSPTRPDSVEI